MIPKKRLDTKKKQVDEQDLSTFPVFPTDSIPDLYDDGIDSGDSSNADSITDSGSNTDFGGGGAGGGGASSDY
jgi:uncharacterized membrane protein YgcG